MRKSISKIALAAGISLALSFTFGCSSDDDGGGGDYNGGISSSSSKRYSSSSVAASNSSSSLFSTPVVSNCNLNGDTVNIGDQVWMAENLNCNISGSKCGHNNEAECDKFGRLYDWSTAMALPDCNFSSCTSQIQAEHQGICPEGWHIPSENEWKALIFVAGGAEIAGKKLKATSGWSSMVGSGNGDDTYGFSALPGGQYTWNFFDVYYKGYWWSATESPELHAYRQDIGSYEEASWGVDLKKYLLSIRCVKNRTPVTYDGEIYETVVIGGQTWMTRNLNYAASGSRCYDDEPANCNKYGRLYDWNTAMKSCPEGWHLPSVDEWQVLNLYIQSDKNTSRYQEYVEHLMAASGWRWNRGLDSYGFSALPGGYGTYDSFYDVGERGYWWSATEAGYLPNALRLRMYDEYDRTRADWSDYDKKEYLSSVRCLKD